MARISGVSVTTVSVAEALVLDGVTGGTVTASKALVVDSNKDLTALRNLTLTNVDVGASGTAGSVDVFPSTASKGKITISAVANTGDTALTITNAAQSATATMTLPDTNGAAEFVMTAAAQTVTGVKTMSGANVITHAPTGLKIQDSNASHLVTIAPGDESADRTLSIPVLGGADTVMTLGTAQTVTGIKTMSGANIVTHAPTGLKVQDSDATHLVTIAAGNESADRTLSIPVLGGADTLMTLATAQAVTGAKTFSVMPIIPVATVAATGTVQGDAAAITTGFTYVTGADDAAGVKLPAAAAGLVCIIKVGPGADLKVWPNTDDAINAIAANSALTVVDDVCFALIALDGVTWYTLPLLPS
jgi:hypothetical protein